MSSAGEISRSSLTFSTMITSLIPFVHPSLSDRYAYDWSSNTK